MLEKVPRIFPSETLDKEMGDHINFGLYRPQVDLSIPCHGVGFKVDVVEGKLGSAILCHLVLELKAQADKGILIN